MTADMIEESSSVGSHQKRDGCGAVVWAQVDIEQLTSTDAVGNVGVSGTLGQVAQQDRSRTLSFVEGSIVRLGGDSRLVEAMVVVVGQMTTAISRSRIVFFGVSISPLGYLPGMNVVVERLRLRVVATVATVVVWAAAVSVWTSLGRGRATEGRRGVCRCSRGGIGGLAGLLLESGIVIAEKLFAGQ